MEAEEEVVVDACEMRVAKRGRLAPHRMAQHVKHVGTKKAVP